MENNEKYIIDQLKEHREDINMQTLWAGVSPHIPKEKRKNRAFYWLFGLIFLIGFAGLSFQLLNSENTTGQISLNERSEQIEIDNENVSITQMHQRSLSAQDKNEVANKENNKSSLNKNSNGSQDIADHITEDPNNRLKTQNILKNEAMPPIKINGSAIDKAVTEPEILTFTAFGLKSGSVDKESEMEPKTLESVQKTGVEPLPILWVNPLTHSSFEMEMPTQTFLAKPVQNSNLNRYTIYMLSGFSYVGRSLQARDIEIQSERDRRYSIVDVLGAWEIEGGIGYKLSPKITISTGIGYTQIHERAKFESDYLVDFEIDSNNKVFKKDGSVENEDGVLIGQGIRHTEETRFNQFRMVRLPIRISYEFMDLNAIKIRIGAMTALSLSQSYNGFTSLSATSERYDLNKDVDNKFKSKGTVSYSLNLEGLVHISRMTDLSFGIGYQKTQNINNEIYLIDQQYTSLSINSGLYRRF